LIIIYFNKNIKFRLKNKNKFIKRKIYLTINSGVEYLYLKVYLYYIPALIKRFVLPTSGLLGEEKEKKRKREKEDQKVILKWSRKQVMEERRKNKERSGEREDLGRKE